MSLSKKNFRAGEIATFLTLVTLGVMVFGSFVGSRIAKRQTTSSEAAGSIQCGQTGCKKNSDCAQNTGFTVLCHLATGQCRPAHFRDACPGGGTARVEVRGKTAGSYCDRTSECVAGLVCTGVPSKCQVPSSGSQSGGSSGGGGSSNPQSTAVPTSSEGTYFNTRGYHCGVGFQYNRDPIVTGLTIRSTVSSGSANICALAADFTEVPSGSTVKTPCETSEIFKPVAGRSGDNVAVYWGPDMDRYKGEPVLVVSINPGGGKNYKFWYRLTGKNNLKFLLNGEPATVKFDYTVTLRPVGRAPEVKNFTQSATSNNTQNCRNPSDTGTPTPSVGTPTPSETGTPTPSQTKTPTPPVETPTSTPGVTEAISRCEGSIHFIIDDTKSLKNSIQEKIGDISRHLNTYFKDPKHKFDRFTVSYTLFNRHVIGGKSMIIDDNDQTISIDYTQGSWTNIQEALEKGVNPSAGVNIIVTDGIHNTTNRTGSITTQMKNLFDALNLPKWIDKDINRTVKNDGQCVFNDSGSSLAGCMPCSASDAVCRGEFDQALGLGGRSGDARDKNFCTALCAGVSKSFSPKKVDYAIAVNGGNVTSLANATIDPSNLNDVVNMLLKDACSKGAGKSASNLSSRGRGGSFNASINLKNRSTTKQVSQMTIKACDQTGNNCVESKQPVSARPGDTIRINQSFSTGDITQNRSERLQISCSLGYSDGSTGQCPTGSLGDDHGLQLSMNVGDSGVTGDARSYRQLSDFDGNGIINGLDYARLLQRYGSDNEDCDIVADGKCNAQDLSVVQGNFGVRVEN